MKHAVLGAGAIGGLMATALSSVGEDVELVVRAAKLATYPERITLQQPAGFITASARAVSRLTEAVDVLWISTKAYQLKSALESVEASPQIVVPLLNGIDHIALLRSRFRDEQYPFHQEGDVRVLFRIALQRVATMESTMPDFNAST